MAKLVAAVALSVFVAAAEPVSAQTPEGTVYFNDPTDTLQVLGQTVLANDSTYEVWIQFVEGNAAQGRVFNEWTGFAEDKVLEAGPASIYAYNHFIGNPLSYVAPLSVGDWHHIAFVQDGAGNEQRIYVDGTKVASVAASGDIGDGSGPGYVGAIPRDGTIGVSMRGFVDSVRISAAALYSGDSFTLPPRNLPNVENALILYDFEESSQAYDLDERPLWSDQSAHGAHGVIGVGFAEATAPAPPARQGDVDCNGSVNATDALKNLRASVGLTNTPVAFCPVQGENLSIAPFGDVDCSGSLAASDALKILKHSVGQAPVPVEGCPGFMEPV